MKFLRFSLTRIILGGIILLVSYVLFSEYLRDYLTNGGLQKPWPLLISTAVTLVLLPLLYKWFFGGVEGRRVGEISLQRFFPNMVWGVLLGVVLQSFVIMVIYAMGGYTVVSVNSPSVMLLPLCGALMTGVFEELVFRGVVFRIVEERLGSWVALLLSALIFGLLHAFNDNATLIDGVAVSIEAGLLLAVCYMLTRNLWMPIMFHAAWNFTQGTVYGAAVSGGAAGESLISAQIDGAKWFTGGGFGPEGSVQAVVLCTLATVVMLVVCLRKGRVVKGALWLKKEERHAADAK